MNLKTFGQELQKRRKDSHLTQSAVAKEFCLTINFLSLVENGKRGMSLTTLAKLCQKYQVSLSEFFRSIGE